MSDVAASVPNPTQGVSAPLCRGGLTPFPNGRHRRTVSTMLGALAWLGGRWIRRRWLALLPLLLVVAVGTAAAMIALGAADRTRTAYPDYLQRAEVGDVVLNPSLSTNEIDEVIRNLPGVEAVTSSSLFSVTDDDGQPRTRQEVESSGSAFTFVIGSSDGRFLEMDRPAVQAGRMPTGASEAAITVDAAKALGLKVGDVMPLSFWQPGLPDGLAGEELERYGAEEIEPIGVERVEIVGILLLPDEVLPDELYPRAKVIVSPDIAQRYECLPSPPPPGRTFREFVDALLPSDCAASYRYYSLAFTDGAAGVTPALDAFLRTSAELNARLADISDLRAVDGTEPPQYFLIPTETAQEARRVDRAVRPAVTALWMLGGAVALVTVGLAALLAAREVGRSRPVLRQWHQLGLVTSSRAVLVGAPIAAAAGVGLAAGAVAGRLLDRGPVGLVRAIEPSPVQRFTGIALVATAALGLTVLLTIAGLAWHAARRSSAPVTLTSRRRSLLAWVGRSASPVASDGIRAAYGQRATLPAVLGSAVLTGGFVAASIFGASLSSVLATPRSYGWPWDVAVVTGFGYGDLDLETARSILEDDPNVESWTAMGFLNEVSLAGEPMMTALTLERLSNVDLPVVSGSLPDEKDEIGLGSRTAANHGLSVGDTVEIGGAFEPLTVHVAGIVVFPSLGPGLADRVGTGTGLLIPQALFDNEDLRGLAQEAVRLATFVGVDLREGTEPAVVADLQRRLGLLDLLDVPGLELPDPVRPPEIVDAGSTKQLPRLVGLVFAAAAGLGLGFASWAATRNRRHDLGVLRALGFTRAQVRRTVYIQSVATMLAALAVGIPLGLTTGRFFWIEFASLIGVVDAPASAATLVALTIGGGLSLAALAALLPARTTANAPLAAALRAE